MTGEKLYFYLIKIFACVQHLTNGDFLQYRMAGQLIAMLRVLRLKAALQATVASPEFIALEAFLDVARVVMIDESWALLFLLCHTTYPQMRILRLADQKVPAMDKLAYFIYQADRLTPKFLIEAEQHIPLLSEGIMEIIDCTDDIASEKFDKRDDELEGLNDDDILGGVLDDTEESLEEDGNNEESHDYSSGDSLASKEMRLWKKHAELMLHNYALAGYLLSPNPTIMAHALAH
eukprot:CCRYP_015163-RA/>CCRYP_015163-RA protein AED:0.38 eAED:0.35 QI:0/0/0/1/1/1/2/0/233